MMRSRSRSFQPFNHSLANASRSGTSIGTFRHCEAEANPAAATPRSQDWPQFHPSEALVEPRIRAQSVPLRRHGEMNQCRIARVDQRLKMLERRVEVSGRYVVHHEPEFLVANIELCHAIRPDRTKVRVDTQQRTRALEIAHLPVRAAEQFTSERMLWIAIERLVGPHDHVVVPALIPE